MAEGHSFILFARCCVRSLIRPVDRQACPSSAGERRIERDPILRGPRDEAPDDRDRLFRGELGEARAGSPAGTSTRNRSGVASAVRSSEATAPQEREGPRPVPPPPCPRRTPQPSSPSKRIASCSSAIPPRRGGGRRLGLRDGEEAAGGDRPRRRRGRGSRSRERRLLPRVVDQRDLDAVHVHHLRLGGIACDQPPHELEPARRRSVPRDMVARPAQPEAFRASSSFIGRISWASRATRRDRKASERPCARARDPATPR
jgi:hypothetical protein